MVSIDQTLPVEIWADMLEDAGVDTSELRAWLAMGLGNGDGYWYNHAHGYWFGDGDVYAHGNGGRYGYEWVGNANGIGSNSGDGARYGYDGDYW